MNSAQLKYLIVDKIYDIDDNQTLLKIKEFIEAEISDNINAINTEVKEELKKN